MTDIEHIRETFQILSSKFIHSFEEKSARFKLQKRSEQNLEQGPSATEIGLSL